MINLWFTWAAVEHKNTEKSDWNERKNCLGRISLWSAASDQLSWSWIKTDRSGVKLQFCTLQTCFSSLFKLFCFPCFRQWRKNDDHWQGKTFFLNQLFSNFYIYLKHGVFFLMQFCFLAHITVAYVLVNFVMCCFFFLCVVDESILVCFHWGAPPAAQYDSPVMVMFIGVLLLQQFCC